MTPKHFGRVIALLVLLCAALVPSPSHAQAIKFHIPVACADSGVEVLTDRHTFGVHPDATICDENPSYPQPPVIVLRDFSDHWAETDPDTVLEFEVPPPGFGFDFRFLK